jgi:hypothetical protein
MNLTIVIIPRTIRTELPAIEIHFRKSGALFNNQPVTPPNNKIGEKAVPNPNKTAIPTLPSGLEKGKE